MSYATLYCNPCEEAVDFIDGTCLETESGRVRAVFLVQKCIDIADPSSAAEWQSLFDNGQALRIRGYGSYSSTSTEGQGVGDQESRIISREHTLAFTDQGYQGNLQAYNVLQRSSSYKAWFVTEKSIRPSDVTISISPDETIEESTLSVNAMLANIKWSNLDLPASYPRPDLEY